MPMSASLHYPKAVKAEQSFPCGAAWLSIYNDAGDHVAVFMPFNQALRMALAFHENPPEPIDPDDPDANDFDDGNITP